VWCGVGVLLLRLRLFCSVLSSWSNFDFDFDFDFYSNSVFNNNHPTPWIIWIMGCAVNSQTKNPMAKPKAQSPKPPPAGPSFFLSRSSSITRDPAIAVLYWGPVPRELSLESLM
jgi:hypothetical protein